MKLGKYLEFLFPGRPFVINYYPLLEEQKNNIVIFRLMIYFKYIFGGRIDAKRAGQIMQMQLVDGEGYLMDPMQWSESLAEEFASRENVQLTPVHWDVIRFMRKYYEDHLVAPDARYTIKHMTGQFGKDARNKLFELFPYGYVQQACKIAGMRRPRNWSTG